MEIYSDVIISFSFYKYVPVGQGSDRNEQRLASMNMYMFMYAMSARVYVCIW